VTAKEGLGALGHVNADERRVLIHALVQYREGLLRERSASYAQSAPWGAHLVDPLVDRADAILVWLGATKDEWVGHKDRFSKEIAIRIPIGEGAR
jgi:hypothetical protein